MFLEMKYHLLNIKKGVINMIIYTMLNKLSNKTFVKVFDNPYLADKYGKKLKHSFNLRIVKRVYDII